MDEPRSIKALREALLKLGLSPEEVQRFLEILGADLKNPRPDEETIRRICEEFADTLAEVGDRFGGKSLLSWRMARFISGGLALSVLGSLVYDLAKAGFAKLSLDEDPSSEVIEFQNGWSVVKKVSSREIADDTGEPYVVTGLLEVRQRLHITVASAATSCSLSLKTYERAERGEPVPHAAAEKIRAGIALLADMHRTTIGYIERRKGRTADTRPNDMFFFIP